MNWYTMQGMGADDPQAAQTEKIRAYTPLLQNYSNIFIGFQGSRIGSAEYHAARNTLQSITLQAIEVWNQGKPASINDSEWNRFRANLEVASHLVGVALSREVPRSSPPLPQEEEEEAGADEGHWSIWVLVGASALILIGAGIYRWAR